MLSQIVQLTAEAHHSKPKLQRWLDEFGERYSKVVMVLSVAVALLGPLIFKWPFLSSSGNMEGTYAHRLVFIFISEVCIAFAYSICIGNLLW